MGCDIHLFVEKKDADGNWEFVYPDRELRKPDPEDEEDWGDDGHWIVYRNYDLFSILAGVRSWDGVKPISAPKDLPEDVSLKMRDVHDRWSGDAHSASYLTLRELVEFDWVGHTIRRKGRLDMTLCARAMMMYSIDPDMARLKYFKILPDMDGKIEGYLKTTHFLDQMKDYITRSKAEVSATEKEKWYDERWRKSDTAELAMLDSVLSYYEGLHDPSLDEKFSEQMFRFDVFWDETYASMADGFYSTMIPALKELGDLDDVRIVFFFDN